MSKTIYCPCCKKKNQPKAYQRKMCIECHKIYQQKSHQKYKVTRRKYHKLDKENHPELYLWRYAKNRARLKGIEFTICIKDIIIPNQCPVLGIDLFQANKERGPISNSPSIDRIDNNKGYIPGNIAIISWRANSLKKDATLDEVKKIHEYMENFQCNG